MSTGTRADDSAGSSAATEHRGLFHRFFFSTERRYQMFQTIVGGTIANLVAAGIVAVIAIAAGALHVSFIWSWPGYWHNVLVTVPAAVGVAAAAAISAHYGDKRSWKDSEPYALWAGGAVIAIAPFLFNLANAVNISLHH